MIKTKLIRLLDHSKKYIYQQVLWQWLALICQIVLIWQVCALIAEAAGTFGVDGSFVSESASAAAGLSVSEGSLTPARIATGAAVIIASALVRVLCDRKAVRASFLASSDVKRVLREKIYSKLLRLGSSYREKISTSELVQLMGEGVEQLETYFGKYLSQFFYSLLAPLTLFLVLFRVNFAASLVLLVCVPLIPGVIMTIQTIAKKLLSKYWDIYADLGDSFLENLQGMTALKTYQADARKQVEMDAEAEYFRKITMKVLQMQLNSVIVMDVVAYGGAAAGMVVTLHEFALGRVSFAGGLMIILLASEFFIPMRLLGSFFHVAMNGMAASDRMFAFLELPEPEAGTEKLSEQDEAASAWTGDNNKGLAESGAPTDGTDSGKQHAKEAGIHGKCAYGLELKDVTFSYTDSAEPVLKNVNLEIPAGSFAALVGLSGCGKSTIAGLFAGRNRGYEGRVVIGRYDKKQTPGAVGDGEHALAGGHEVSALDPDDLHCHLTIVSSDSFLFKGTVRENLLPACPGASDEILWQALGKVRLAEFLKNESGLDTEVASGGANLSGGQRQRLALARALLHDADIYIFDEATSNIDSESEELIMDAIHAMAGEKTILVISHRLANAVGADLIFFLQNGTVAESGTHGMLLEANGGYAALYRRQKAMEEYGTEVPFSSAHYREAVG